ncbi:cupin domain-containing protein [Paeniglutamicibacter sp. NPDC091659]|uniref:cupin domain-containing protein n=1 Tax=Paeniglutamicibacter sp. NPDC091659 TaxID=3364389 RepID=UPI00381F79AF
MAAKLIHLPAAGTAELGAFAPKATALTEGLQEASREIWSADSLEVGVWEATPGTFTAFRDEYHEVCQILSGSVTITSEGGCGVLVGAGDTVVMPAGWKGLWEIHETVRKTYVILSGVDNAL